MTLYLETKALAYDNADAEEVAERYGMERARKQNRKVTGRERIPENCWNRSLGSDCYSSFFHPENLYHKRKYPCRMYHRLHVERKMFRRA